jgi:hypothetical protein
MNYNKTKIIIPEKLPFLESICWQTKDVYQFTLEEMLNAYERGWKYHSLFDNLREEELEFIKKIAHQYQSWLIVDLCSLN